MFEFVEAAVVTVLGKVELISVKKGTEVVASEVVVEVWEVVEVMLVVELSVAIIKLTGLLGFLSSFWELHPKEVANNATKMFKIKSNDFIVWENTYY